MADSELRIAYKAAVPTLDSIVLARAAATKRDTALAVDTSQAVSITLAGSPLVADSMSMDFRLASKHVADMTA